MIIAGAGTGGHLFPGIAVAQELKRIRSDIRILFVTEKRRLSRSIIKGYGFDSREISVEGIMGRGIMRLPVAILKLMFSMVQTARIIREFKPCLVLGTGGYTSGPVCIVARAMGVTVVLHEQNYYPGFTNRFLGRFADKVFISFKESSDYFSSSKCIYSGNPVRKEIITSRGAVLSDKKGFTILITGGSQGAHAINVATLEAMKILKLKGRLPSIIHQSGESDYEWLKEQYDRHGIGAQVEPFITDMADAYKRADLVICRAGASTVSELTLLGKPSILIPFPHATEDHQLKNATLIAQRGAGRLLPQEELDGEKLGGMILEFMDREELLRRMSYRARGMGKPDALRIIAQHMVKLMEIEETNT